ncbi:hypothetical protein D3C77_560210 [compost metagenome]
MDGLAPVGDKLIAFPSHLIFHKSGFNVLKNRLGIFRTGIVGGHDDMLRIACGDFAHQRALCAIPVASAAKYADDPPCRKFGYCAQHVLQAVRRMSIVDNNGERLPFIHSLYASIDPFKGLQAFFNPIQRNTFQQTCRDGG